MSKPLNEFGGWLSFFYIISWLATIGFIMLVLTTLPAIFKVSKPLEIVAILIYYIGDGINAFLNFKIVKVITVKDAKTPNKVLTLVTWISLLTVLFIIPGLWLDYILRGGKAATEMGKGVIKVLVWYFIWTSYFQKSKRVFAYYGKNADNLFFKR
jgi:hypothetical protein